MPPSNCSDCAGLPCLRGASGETLCVCDGEDPSFARPPDKCLRSMQDCTTARLDAYTRCNGDPRDLGLPGFHRLLRCDAREEEAGGRIRLECARSLLGLHPSTASCDPRECGSFPVMNSADRSKASRYCWNFSDLSTSVQSCGSGSYCRNGRCAAIGDPTADVDWGWLWRGAVLSVVSTAVWALWWIGTKLYAKARKSKEEKERSLQQQAAAAAATGAQKFP